LPLALTAARRFDERRQRALCRYYLAAGAGGIAAAVHTTQFAIRDPRHGLIQPVLALAAEEMDRAASADHKPIIKIGGICGPTHQATAEAQLLRDLGYHAGLLSLVGVGPDDDARLAHCRAVAEIIPLVGFYLQRAVGGPDLSYRFWRAFAEIDAVVAIKVAPFDRYRTLDVVRAVCDSGRDDIALYTGNDDNIVLDLLTPSRFERDGRLAERWFAGGLLGHWAVWTRKAVELLEACHAARRFEHIPRELLDQALATTDANAALFDAANGFAGCIAGVHEILRRQGLLAGIECLDPNETLSPGQLEEIDRVVQAYPWLTDDAFVANYRDDWLRS
jgi:dihydrodipicolinate synthase/N-acetylneuraminate lyase